MKKKVIVSVIIILLSISILYVVVSNTNSKSNVVSKKIYTMHDLEEYGDYLETLDLKPNTIVASFDGEPILFHEIKWHINQRKYAEENSNSSSLIPNNSFLKALYSRAYVKIAKDYPDYTGYGLHLSETIQKLENEWNNGDKEKLLNVVGIETEDIWLNDESMLNYMKSLYTNMDLEGKGLHICMKLMYEKPEISGSKEVIQKVKEYQELTEYLKDNKDETQTSEEYKEKMKRQMNLILEIRNEFMEAYILNNKIKLLANENKLYTDIPDIYEDSENPKEGSIADDKTTKEEAKEALEKMISNFDKGVDDLDPNYFLIDFENYHPNNNEIKISESKAKEIAQYGFDESKSRIAGEGADDTDSETIVIEEVLANNYFTRKYSELDKMYKNISRKCYVVKRENEMGCGIKVYVDVTTGLIIGGGAFGD